MALEKEAVTQRQTGLELITILEPGSCMIEDDEKR